MRVNRLISSGWTEWKILAQQQQPSSSNDFSKKTDDLKKNTAQDKSTLRMNDEFARPVECAKPNSNFSEYLELQKNTITNKWKQIHCDDHAFLTQMNYIIF